MKDPIPYIDIGMDVHDCKDQGFLISGQVFLSTPGNPCMRFCRIVTDENLRREAERYGAAGSNPQVVWANSILAATAIGLAVRLVTPWHSTLLRSCTSNTMEIAARFHRAYICAWRRRCAHTTVE